jgi:hypothetical protein
MTHEEYVARIEEFTDSAEDVAAVLAHARSCAACQREEQTAEKALAPLGSGRKSLAEEVARWSAAAAILALVVFGIHKEAGPPAGPVKSATGARYVIVGDASGVVAYTPEGVVMGVVARKPPSKRR